MVAVPDDEMGVVPAESVTILRTASIQNSSSFTKLKPVDGANVVVLSGMSGGGSPIPVVERGGHHDLSKGWSSVTYRRQR